MELQESKFVIDTLGDEVFGGFTSNENWNGWACPYFTFEQGQRIVNAFLARAWKASYDENSDQFVFSFGHDGLNEEDTFSSELVEGRKLYPIGARCWIWEELVDEDASA